MSSLPSSSYLLPPHQVRTSPAYDTPSDDDFHSPAHSHDDDDDSAYDDQDEYLDEGGRRRGPPPIRRIDSATEQSQVLLGGVVAEATSGEGFGKPATRTAQACNPCRKSKTKCQGSVDGGSCLNCVQKRRDCHFDAKPSGDRAAESRKRAQDNEAVRNILGDVLFTRIGRGEDLDELLSNGTGRLAGRVSGGGVSFVEDMNRICHDTPKDNDFVAIDPFRTILVAHARAEDLIDFDPVQEASEGWDWKKGKLMHAPGFLQGEKGPAWLPARKTCEELIEVFFQRLHPLMPLFIPSQFMGWFESLWLPGGSDERSPKSFYPSAAATLSPQSSPAVPGRTPIENQRLQFFPILFAVLACAEANLSRDQAALREGEEYYRHAMINLHFVEDRQLRTDGLPQLWKIQTLALLASHLAGLNRLGAAWGLTTIAAGLVKERELYNPSKCGQGPDAQVRRRVFWCVYNLDSLLSRMLALKPNFSLNPTHSMLPEPLDPDTPGWESFFVAQKEPNISSHTTPTLAIGFILICEANLLATDAVRELYPQFRDRSEDWKEVGTRNDLNSKIAEFEGRLATLRERMAGFEVQGRGEDSVKVLQLSVGDLFAEVGLLIRRVQLPRQGPKATWDRALSPLGPSLRLVEGVLANTPSRALVPTSIYLALSVYTIFSTSLPLLHARIRTNTPGGPALDIDGARIDKLIMEARTLLFKLNSVYVGAEVYSEGIKELKELSVSWGEKKNGTGLKVKINSTKGSLKKARRPKAEPTSPGDPVQAVDSISGGSNERRSSLPPTPGLPLQSPPLQSPSRTRTPYERPKSKGRPASYNAPPSSFPTVSPMQRMSSHTGASGSGSGPRSAGATNGYAQGTRPRSRTMSSTVGNGRGATINPQQLGNDQGVGGGFFRASPGQHHQFLDGPSYMEGDSNGNNSPYSPYSPTTPSSLLPTDPHVGIPDWEERRYSHDAESPYGPPHSSYASSSRPVYPSDVLAGSSRGSVAPYIGNHPQHPAYSPPPPPPPSLSFDNYSFPSTNGSYPRDEHLLPSIAPYDSKAASVEVGQKWYKPGGFPSYTAPPSQGLADYGGSLQTYDGTAPSTLTHYTYPGGGGSGLPSSSSQFGFPLGEQMSRGGGALRVAYPGRERDRNYYSAVTVGGGMQDVSMDGGGGSEWDGRGSSR